MALPKENPAKKNLQQQNSVSKSAEENGDSQLEALLILMAELNIINSGSKNEQKSTAFEKESEDLVAGIGSFDLSEKSPSVPGELEESPLFESSPEKELKVGKKNVGKRKRTVTNNPEKIDSPEVSKDELKRSDRVQNPQKVKPSKTPKTEKTSTNKLWLLDPKDAVVDILSGGETRVRHSNHKEKLQQQRVAKQTAKEEAEADRALGEKFNDLIDSQKSEGKNKQGKSQGAAANENGKSANKQYQKLERETAEKNPSFEKEKWEYRANNDSKNDLVPESQKLNKGYGEELKNGEYKFKSASAKEETAEAEAISGFFDILLETEATEEKAKEESDRYLEKSPPNKQRDVENVVENQPATSPKRDEIVIDKIPVAETEKITAKKYLAPSKVESNKLARIPKAAPTQEIPVEKSSDASLNTTPEEDAFLSLQNLLVGPEINNFKELNSELEDKLKNIQHTISDPQELTNLMLPLISDLLSLKIAQAKQEVAWAIAPILDEAIERKTVEDPQGIVRAMAPLMVPAITAQISKSPKEFAKAIAPEIAAAVEEQIRLGRDTMADALAPIIDRMIQKKTQDDRQSIIDAIAPLLPGAISEQIKNSPQEVARAIGPEIGQAIREQIKIDRNAIAEAIAPEMGRAIKEQITLERDSMVDALYPVIGSTIARYMAEAIQEINEKITKAVSMDGFSRKIRAKVQGVSEAELILSEVMHFTVQAVFLIHKGSGLIICEAQHPGRERLESEMVAGMLTAIRSFVNDCILQSGEVSELNEIEYGASKIMIEVAGYCYLAVVVKGEPTKKFIKKMRNTVSTLIIKHGKAIEEFEGDPESVPEEIKPLLEQLMEVINNPQKAAKFPVALIFLMALFLGGIFLPLGYYRHRLQEEQRIAAEVAAENARIEQTVAGAWASSPSLALYSLNADVEEGAIALSGRLPNQRLRDKAEEIAKEAAPNLELDNKIVAVEVPPEPEEVMSAVERVTGALNQIKGVSVVTEYAEEKVKVEGTVTDMAQSKIIVGELEQIPGVKSVVSTIKLSPLTLENRIYFDVNSAKLKSAYQETIVEIQQFMSQYPQKHLKIQGYSDRLGSQKKNEALATKRAEAVRDALVEEGVDPRRLEVIGNSTPPPDVESNQPLLLSRCVLFEPFEPGAK
ncbi:MAG: OmpA family protein [Cyanobacteriota bacterium]|nr:OmpA family protein [Cyanobacteriota bacterium]